MKLAIFDFDGTLYSKEVLPFLLSHWKSSKYSRFKCLKIYIALLPLYFKYKLGMNSKLTREQMKIMAMESFNSIFTGMSKQEIMEFFYSASEALKNKLSKSIVDEVRRAKVEGYHTVLLSGSYYILLKYLGEKLGFDTIIGTEVFFNNEFIDTSQKLEIVSGMAKLEKTKESFKDKAVDWIGSIAYADSFSDLHILEAVGNPVAVNPDDKLKAIAKERNWKIMN